MEFKTKQYHIIKTKNYCKNNNFFIFFNGVNRPSSDWILVEQKLKKTNFSYYKIYNKTSKKTLQKSVYLNVSSLINSITFFIKPVLLQKEITKKTLINNFEPLLFSLLALKLNNRIYSKDQLKNNFSFNYKDNKLLLFQFSVLNIKLVINKNVLFIF